MSPTTSHTFSINKFGTSETVADAECLTSSTAGDANVLVNKNIGDDDDDDDLHIVNNVNNSHSCSHCGSINSNKSAIATFNDEHATNINDIDFSPANRKKIKRKSSPSIKRDCCVSNSRMDLCTDPEQQCYLTETLSRRSSISHLSHDQISSYGSYSSLSYRSSTPGTSDGAPKINHHHHHRHHHHHAQQRQPQVYYQTHHSLCKRVSALSHQSSSSSTAAASATATATGHINRNHCRHRRKSSCSTTFGDSFRRRKRIDTESSSFRGSNSSIYEPLHIDVSTPSANTVILTPSKITIEHNQTTEMRDIEHGESNGSINLHQNVYTPSPIEWNFVTEYDDSNRNQIISSDKTDIIEVLSGPDELYRNNNLTVNDNNSYRQSSGKKEIPQKKYQQHHSRDANAFSTWQTTTTTTTTENNEETTNTIMFHHESDVVENCCDNYFHCNNNSDTDIELYCSERSEYTSKDGNAMQDEEQQFKSSNKNYNIGCGNNKCIATSLPNPTECLNNSGVGASSQATTTTQLPNFHKNNISSVTNRRLDLSPDIRRYSKITNLEQQNASNLMPNYFHCSSSNINQETAFNSHGRINPNLETNYFVDNKFIGINRTASSPQTPLPSSTRIQEISQSQIMATTSSSIPRDFELFNISTSSRYEKPFGGISLTTQNQFEPYSNRCQSINNNNNHSSSSTNSDRNMELHEEQHQHQENFGNTSPINTIDLYEMNEETMSHSNTNGTIHQNNIVDDTNNNINYANATSIESLMSDRRETSGLDDTRGQQLFGLNSLFGTIRKGVRKYTNFLNKNK